MKYFRLRLSFLVIVYLTVAYTQPYVYNIAVIVGCHFVQQVGQRFKLLISLKRKTWLLLVILVDSLQSFTAQGLEFKFEVFLSDSCVSPQQLFKAANTLSTLSIHRSKLTWMSIDRLMIESLYQNAGELYQIDHVLATLKSMDLVMGCAKGLLQVIRRDSCCAMTHANSWNL